MTYGVPPLHDVDDGVGDTGDLPTHSIFDTYYTQVEVDFVIDQRIEKYDVQADAGDPAGKVISTGPAYYDIVTVDISNLDPSVGVHLDLYSDLVIQCAETEDCTIADIDIDQFAPFSHDAQTSSSSTSTGQASTTSSTGQSSTGNGVPEPSTLTLLGFGMLGGLLYSRRRKNKSA
jgi:hypothetical protein